MFSQEHVRLMPRILALTAYLFVSVSCAFHYITVPPSPDQSIFDFIGWEGLHGTTWYVEGFDVAWPGSFLIAELGIRFFGVHTWTARLFDFILLQPAVAAIYLLMASAGLPIAAMLAAIAYPIIYVTSGYWMAGHRDIVAMHLLIIASALILTSGSRHFRMSIVSAGALIAFATLIRPTYLLFMPLAVLLYCAYRSPLLRRSNIWFAAVLVSGAVLVFATFTAFGLSSGAFFGWIDACRFVLSDVYQDHTSRWLLLTKLVYFLRVYVAWLTATAALGLVLWKGRRSQEHLAFILAMFATSLISFFVQNKGFGYHLGGLIPLLTILAFAGVEPLFGVRERTFSFATMISASIALLLAAGVFSRIEHNFVGWSAQTTNLEATARTQTIDSEAMASIVRNETCENERVYQWGSKVDFLFYAQRLSPTRFIATPIFSGIKANDKSFGLWLEEFSVDLSSRKPPAFVLMDVAAIPPNTPDSAALAILRSVLDRNYSVRLRSDSATLYELRGRRLCATPPSDT